MFIFHPSIGNFALQRFQEAKLYDVVQVFTDACRGAYLSKVLEKLLNCMILHTIDGVPYLCLSFAVLIKMLETNWALLLL